MGTAPEHRDWALGEKGIRREERNLDLVIHLADSSTLIVENKVKSVPYAEQLKRYEEEVRKLEGIYPNARYLLLTLSPGDAPECSVWPVLSYGEVAERLAQAATTLGEGYERHLVEDYAGFIRSLSALGVTGDTDPWIDDRPLLRELRIADLLQKRKASWLARSLMAGLDSETLVAKPGTKSDALEPGQLLVYDGLTNGNGLVGFVMAIGDGPKLEGARALPRIGMGVQLQGNQYRSFVQLLRPTNPGRKALTAFHSLCLKLFNESPEPGWWPPADRGASRKDLCTYGGTFLYRYRTLSQSPSESTLQALATKLEASARAVMDGAEAIRLAIASH